MRSATRSGTSRETKREGTDDEGSNEDEDYRPEENDGGD